jgi:hypothetical protein
MGDALLRGEEGGGVGGVFMCFLRQRADCLVTRDEHMPAAVDGATEKNNHPATALRTCLITPNTHVDDEAGGLGHAVLCLNGRQRRAQLSNLMGSRGAFAHAW